MMTLANSVAALTLVRFGFFHGGRGEGFGTFLVGVVLVTLVAWVVVRSSRDAA